MILALPHTLQIVVKDELKQAGSITKVLSKAAHIVSFIRRQTLATDILEGDSRLQSALDGIQNC